MSMSRKAKYEIALDHERYLVIRDLGPWNLFQTVTNAAESVVEELAPQLNGRQLYYYDSDGTLDEILVVDNKFAGFAPGPEDLQQCSR